jgi:hypothetical protein
LRGGGGFAGSDNIIDSGVSWEKKDETGKAVILFVPKPKT